MSDGLLVPIALERSPLTGLLIIDVADDPTYRALEPQIQEGSDGIGLLVLAYRHDGQIEVYAEPHVQIDPARYDGLDRGLLGIFPTVFDPARFEVTHDGLRVDLAFTAPNGHSIDLRLHEHLGGRRDHVPVLAPVGGAFAAPSFFPFIWLPAMSFVPASGTEVTLRVDGQERTIPRLPLPIGRRRCLMARYDLDAMVCQFNPSWVDDPRRAPAVPDTSSRDDVVDVVDVQGHLGLAGVQVRRGAHRCSVRLEPPLPDLRRARPGVRLEGAVELCADEVSALRGRYTLERTGEQVRLVVDRIGPWRSRQRRLVLGVLFRLPLFRRWPTTYRWQATLHLTGPPGTGWESRWSRVDGARGASGVRAAGRRG